MVILCGGERWLFFSLEFSGNFCFSLLYVVFALLVLLKLCSFVSLSLLLDLFFTCYGRLVVFRCGDGSVYCSCSTNTRDKGGDKWSNIPTRCSTCHLLCLLCLYTNTGDKGDDKWSNIHTRKDFVPTLRTQDHQTKGFRTGTTQKTTRTIDRAITTTEKTTRTIDRAITTTENLQEQ